MDIRSAQIEDFDRINELYEYVDKIHREVYTNRFRKPDVVGRSKPYLKDLIFQRNSQLIVAEQNGEIIGFAESYINGCPDYLVLKERTWLQVDTIAVDEKHRGRGVGQALLDFLVDWGKELGVEEVELKVFSFNESAIKFYEKNGFRDVSRTMVKNI